MIENDSYASAVSLRIEKTAKVTGERDLLELIVTSRTPEVLGGEIAANASLALQTDTKPPEKSFDLKAKGAGLIAQNPSRPNTDRDLIWPHRLVNLQHSVG
jgi:hypothetical protein